MANVDNPHGLMPLMRTLSGGGPQVSAYTKEVGYAQAIRRWDPVTQLAGVLNGPQSGITPGTTLYLGVALEYSPASTAKELLVMDQADAVFDVQEDDSGAANVVAAKMGYNANLTTTAGGSPTDQTSKVELSGTSIATTATLDVRILRLLADPTNAYGAWARLEVFFNKHLRHFGVTAT